MGNSQSRFRFECEQPKVIKPYEAESELRLAQYPIGQSEINEYRVFGKLVLNKQLDGRSLNLSIIYLETLLVNR